MCASWRAGGRAGGWAALKTRACSRVLAVVPQQLGPRFPHRRLHTGGEQRVRRLHAARSTTVPLIWPAAQILIYFMQTVLLFFAGPAYSWMTGVGTFSSASSSEQWSLCPLKIGKMARCAFQCMPSENLRDDADSAGLRACSVMLPASYFGLSVALLVTIFLVNFAVWLVAAVFTCKRGKGGCGCEFRDGAEQGHGFPCGIYLRTLICA
jgi:hypothetical protein